MTITLGWITRFKQSTELIFASDSRLRSYGALDQCQKVFPLERGDCCLGFCGDAQIAYPLFIQVGTALNNYIKTRTRGTDVTQVQRLIGQILNNLISSWDISPSEKSEWLKDTRILFGGWSWLNKRFDIGFFKHESDGFGFHHEKTRLPYPWREKDSSLVFIGDYKKEYLECVSDVLAARYKIPSAKSERVDVSLKYEPIEALQRLLEKEDGRDLRPLIGGAAQMVKVYQFGNSLPFAVRTSQADHFLFGRKLFSWEKTERPILDLGDIEPRVVYPMALIPTVADYQSKAVALGVEEESGFEGSPEA